MVHTNCAKNQTIQTYVILNRQERGQNRLRCSNNEGFIISQRSIGLSDPYLLYILKLINLPYLIILKGKHLYQLRDHLLSGLFPYILKTLF